MSKIIHSYCYTMLYTCNQRKSALIRPIILLCLLFDDFSFESGGISYRLKDKYNLKSFIWFLWTFFFNCFEPQKGIQTENDSPPIDGTEQRISSGETVQEYEQPGQEYNLSEEGQQSAVLTNVEDNQYQGYYQTYWQNQVKFKNQIFKSWNLLRMHLTYSHLTLI